MASRSRVQNWRIRVEFKREDCWIGVFWRTERTSRGLLTTWWVCLLPMVPIVIQHGRTVNIASSEASE